MTQETGLWANNYIGEYLKQNQGDPFGVLDPQKVADYLVNSQPTWDGDNNRGWVPSDAQISVTPEEIEAFLVKMREPPTDPIGLALYNSVGQNNDWQWAPTYNAEDGTISWGAPLNDGGFLDKITPIVENAMALSGAWATPLLAAEIAAGAGAAGAAGAAGSSSAAGYGGIPELGLVADAATANAAIAGGVPAATLEAGGGLLPGMTQAEARAFVGSSRDAIEAIIRTDQVGGAQALGFSSVDEALQNLVPSMLNAAANGVPGASSGLPSTPSMPPAQAELPAPNATPGNVTAASGLDNAVTAGAAGTSGAVGAGGLTLPDLPPTPPIKDLKDALGAASNAVGLATAVGAIGEGVGNAGDDPYASLRADEEARQGRIRNSVADIRSQFGRFDDNYLKGVSSSYLDYYLPQFNEQSKEARRQVVFNTPSAGTSAFARRAGQLETDIGRQEANIRSQAQAQAQSQKAKLANQEETLISQAEGAGGIADASARAASAADIASTPEAFSPLGQLFAAYTGNVANAAQAERLGYQPTGIVPNIFSRPGGRQPVQYVG